MACMKSLSYIGIKPHAVHVFNSMYSPSNAGVFLFERTPMGTRVCLIRERSGKWNIPSGGVYRNESGTRAAVRELYEETSHVIDFNRNSRYNSIQIGSFHLVFIETYNGFWIDSTSSFEYLRGSHQLGQNETTDMQWVFVHDLYAMAICKKLRRCFETLLHKPAVINKLSELDIL